MNRVVDYIEKNLSSPLPIDELTDIAAFSAYHFHRIFKKTMNENVHRFINRLRVEKAAKLLIFQTERSLSDISLECGLQSSAHFSRTFRSHIGLSPSEYRSRYNLNAVTDSFRGSHEAAGSRQERWRLLESRYNALKISINVLPERQAACIRYQGTINTDEPNPDISDAFNRAEAWMRARDLLVCNSMYIGVIPSDPYITPATKHRYSACITTDLPFAPTLDVERITLPGGKYAVVYLEDQADIVRDLIHLVSIQWLPLSPYVWDDSRHQMEIFYGDPLSDPDHLVRVEFCIPVKPK
ncbi:AraC family transcriptional regulator [Cohnella mopanensis]|uniref:AraC family transcriptional regulator n=1 Tax=Cohnella mopanensis TaxID=2911966 RepID=UPI001EF818EE|nr:AraC family transcriptional regulator [Cohnella mopanensis]